VNVLVVGGGPGGLYVALLLKRRRPDAVVTVVERNRPDDTFGWGVVLSDQTVANLREADPESADAIAGALHRWDDIAIHFGGRTIRSGGHGFSGIGRQRLLTILQARCREVGVRLRFEAETDAGGLEGLVEQEGAALVIAADGINSRLRERFAATYRPDIDVRDCRFVWLGTPRTFDAFTFAFRETDAGWFQAHAYQFDEGTSTFIVETPQAVWARAGLAEMSDVESRAYCATLFADILGGAPLLSNAAHLRGSAQWIRFPRVTCAEWVHWLPVHDRQVPVVLLGDAAHTAHFSIGSGSKLALEDAIALDRQLAGDDIAARPDHLRSALASYQAERAVEVLKLQNAARNSTEWFEHVERYARLAPEQFAYSLLTRSQRISHENLRLRDPAYVAAFERWFAHQAGLAGHDAEPAPPAIFTPFTVRGVTLANRIVVSPMAQYSAAADGTPTDWHLVHLGARATGGAGLVMTEMTCVAPDARITPVCPGLWTEAHRDAWARIVRFVHEHSPARIGLQLGHAGAKGATKTMWEGIDQPLESGAWPLMAASALPYLDGISQTPREMTEADMARVTSEFVRATELGRDAGFDWLELHAAHGYLLSGFLSPLTNHRPDAYGGALAARARFPLQVFAAMRAVWPADRPMSVRLSAHDWVAGGNTDDEAVALARLFRDAGADVIDVSAGQVVKRERPVYGRMWQTPFADRVRQEAGIATIAVGAITDADQATGIIASGRADLVAIGRPHLANPAWTLTEAARHGYRGAIWPVQYLAGKSQLERLIERERAMAGATTGAADAAPPKGELT
jgi:anthraniloyl-CoA monooxygenase